MARVRSTVVGGKRYLQVVESQPGGSISVLQSFGEYDLENWLRATQFANSFNQLREIAKSPPQATPEDLLQAALAIWSNAAWMDGLIVGVSQLRSRLLPLDRRDAGRRWRGAGLFALSVGR